MIPFKYRFISLFLTHKCGMNCPYCFEENSAEEMSEKTLDDIFAFIDKYGIPYKKHTIIGPYGGEPLIKKDLFLKIIRKYKGTAIDVYQITNGLLIDDDIIRECAGLPNVVFALSADTINTSVKNIEALKNTLIKLKQNNIRTMLQAVVYKDNYNKMYDYYLEAIKYVDTVYFQRLFDASEYTEEMCKVMREQSYNIAMHALTTRNNVTIMFPNRTKLEGRNFYKMGRYCMYDNEDGYKTYTIDERGDIYQCEVCASQRKQCIGNIYDPENVKPIEYEPSGSDSDCPFLNSVGNVFFDKEFARFNQDMNRLINFKLSVVEITDICNHSCKFCCKPWREDRDMSYEILDKILDLPVERLLISGGEPGLRMEKLKYLIDRFKGIRVIMNTNLSMFSLEDIDYMNNHNVLLRVDLPSIHEQEFNALTQTHNYKNVIEKLPYVKFIEAAVIAYNGNDWKGTVEELYSRFRVKDFLVNYAMNVDNEFEMREFMNGLAEFIKLHPCMKIHTVAKLYEDMPRIYGHSCEAGTGRLVIQPDGIVTPCSWNRTPVLGNILTDNLKTIIDNGYEFRKNHADSICKYKEGA